MPRPPTFEGDNGDFEGRFDQLDEYVAGRSSASGLYAVLKALPWAQVRAHSTVQTGHGRRVRRTIKVQDAPAWTQFPGAAQVAQIRRTVTQAGKKSVELMYVITAAEHTSASPATLATWIQGQWRIENQLHSGPRCHLRPGPFPSPHRQRA